MKTRPSFVHCLHQFGILTLLGLSIVTAKADPIELPEKPITPEISLLIAFAILSEVICIWLILRRSQKPRLFILWLIGIHVLTYPSFLGLLWLLQSMRPAYAAGIAEGLIILVEGTLIYLICHAMASAKSSLAAPSLIKCWLASLIGNICSAVAFPILMAVYDRLVLD